MILYCLVAFLLVIIILIYFYNKKDFFTPIGLCCIGFLFAALSSIINIDNWHFDMEVETFLVLVTGIISMCIGFVIFSKAVTIIQRNKSNQKQYLFYHIRVRHLSYALFILLQFTTIFLNYDHIISITGGDTLAEHMMAYRLLDLSGESDIPSYISIPNLFCQWAVYIFAYKFVSDYIIRKRIDYFALVTIILNFILSFFSSAKGPIIWFIIGLFTIAWITYSRKKQWYVKLSFSRFMKFLLMCLFGLLMMVLLAYLLGREESENIDVEQILEYLSMYLGAELKLLDNFISCHLYLLSPNWMGYGSFHFLYSWLGTKFDVANWINNDSMNLLDFDYVDRYSLGNVYTCFSIYLLDFGLIGLLFMPFIMGAIFGIMYSYIRFASNEPNSYGIDVALLIYSNIAFTMILSFFSDWFFSYVFSPWFIKGVISLFIAQAVFLKQRGEKIYVNK